VCVWGGGGNLPFPIALATGLYSLYYHTSRNLMYTGRIISKSDIMLDLT